MSDIEVQSCNPCHHEQHHHEQHHHEQHHHEQHHHEQHHPCPPPHHCPQPHPCAQQNFQLSEAVNVTVNKGQEVNHDFILHHNVFKDFGTISGTVKDQHGHPLAHALVKVFDNKHRPFTHVFTNHEGQFLICVPPGHYILKAVR